MRSKASTTRDFAFFYLNGKAQKVFGKEIFLNLSDYLRIQKSLTGTKVVCAEGDCGACSVLRAFPKPGQKGETQFEAINSCIIRVGQLDGSSLVTIEGLRDLMPNKELHPIQKSMVACHGSQCGFCTPGIVVTMAAALNKKSITTVQEAKNSLTGNLCRCTGYLPIVEAVLQSDLSQLKKIESVFLTPEIEKHIRSIQKQSVLAEVGDLCFEAPADIPLLKKLRGGNLSGVVLGAGTDLGVAANKGRFHSNHFLSLHLIPELYSIKKDKSELRIGARVSLEEFRRHLSESSQAENFLHVFASPQIKNIATVAGNVANASPIGDTPPLLLALDAEVEIFSPSSAKTKWIKIEEFYKAYKVTALNKGDLIWSIKVQIPQKNDHVHLAKVSQRRDLDISCVNAGFLLRHNQSNGDSTNVIMPSLLRLALGGVGPTPLRLLETESFLLTEGLSKETLAPALDLAQTEIKPIGDLRGSENYRRLVVNGLLKKFLSEAMELQQ